MTTVELIKEFIGGSTKGSASANRLRIEGNDLVNYNTVIAYRIGGWIVLNNTRYSRTTTAHQNAIRRYHSGIRVEAPEDLARKLSYVQGHSGDDLIKLVEVMEKLGVKNLYIN